MSHPVPPYRVAYTTFRELGTPNIDWGSVRVTDAKNNPVSKIAAARILSSAGHPYPKENPMKSSCSCHENPLSLSRNTWIAIGLGAAGVAAGFAIASMAKTASAATLPAAPPATPAAAWKQVSAINSGTGQQYDVATVVPTLPGSNTMMDRASLASELSALGWSGQIVYYPGLDPVTAWPSEIPPPNSAIATSWYVFRGTYSGAPFAVPQTTMSVFTP